MAHLRFGMLQNRVKKGQSFAIYVFPDLILIQNVLRSVIFFWETKARHALISLPIVRTVRIQKKIYNNIYIQNLSTYIIAE